MFWTVFFSMLFVAYLIGSLMVLGIVLVRWDKTIGKDAQSFDYWYVTLACILSWITIGIFAVAVYEEVTEN
jgi:hypothetical protein